MVNLSTIHSSQGDFPQTYREWRRLYYSRFPLFWGTFPSEHTEEYALYGALSISHQQATMLRTASFRLYWLLARLARQLQQADARVLLDIGIPPSALPYSRIVLPGMAAVMCGRFEFALTVEGPKLLEFNAETPTFVVELFSMNSQICADFGLADPNHESQAQLAQALHDSIIAGIHSIERPPDTFPSVVFSAYSDHTEERNTTEFYWGLLRERSDLPYRTSFHGLDELRVTRDRLLTAKGERIDVLYKQYPTDYLIEDQAPNGTPVGLALMELVRKRHLAIINPPISFVLQNKALMAVLWAMHTTHSTWFTSEEHAWIEQYMLPTYFAAHNTQGQPLFTGQYVVKPVYGREGGSVTIRNSHEVIEHSQQNDYDNQVMVYQQYAPLPKTTIQTEEGLAEVHLVHNCFVVAGKPSAIGVRAARKLIFDDNSYFLPVCYSLASEDTSP